MSTIKPIHLHSHARGPNPFKVLIILEELGVPYEPEHVDMSKTHEEPYISINPNGRLPAIEDPNTGIVLWESGAIIEYLLENYDTANKLSYTSFPEKYLQGSWKHFQMSGQGPYFGQWGWFTLFHPEKVPSAIERYANEIRRVMGVIEYHLDKTGKPYLVGDRCTFADLMFVPWNFTVCVIDKDFEQTEWPEKYPKSHAWYQNLLARDGVKRAIEARAEREKQHGH